MRIHHPDVTTFNFKRGACALLVGAFASVGFTTSAHAVVAPVTTDHPVYESDFTANPYNADPSNVRGTAAYGFGPKGLVLETQNGSDKVAKYFAPATSTFPTSGAYEWTGTTVQASAQVIFSVTGFAFNTLVGEKVYSTNAAGQPLTDWWMTGGSARAALRGITCPSTTTDSGSDCHGSLADFKALNPSATPLAYGFSLGTGPSAGSGYLTSTTFDSTRYVYTEGSAPVAIVDPPVVSPPVTTPGATPVANSQASFTHKKKGHGIVFRFYNTGTVGPDVQWTVTVNKTQRCDSSQQVGGTSKFRYNVPRPGHAKKVRVFENGQLVGTYKVR